MEKARNQNQEEFENLMEWETLTEGSKVGYLFNIKPHKVLDENRKEVASVLLYMVDEACNAFKVVLRYDPYFYVLAHEEFRSEVLYAITRRFGGMLKTAEIVEKVDLDLPNHLAGLKQTYIKLTFANINDLISVRNTIKQKMRLNAQSNFQDYLESIQDTREHDVIYYTRVAIDLDLRCGKWYQVSFRNSQPQLNSLPEKLTNPRLRVLAFDIETVKSPFKFPDARIDPIMMISYMIDGVGFLIVNREVVSEDIEDFEYTPKPEFKGEFTVLNEANEFQVLTAFFYHIKKTKPLIFSTFNGDYFDWPYIKTRASINGLDMEKEIGVYEEAGEFKGRLSIHMDCLYWVKRDAYLPQGSHGLKKVTKAKLGYEPVELDPEEMVPFAKNNPQGLAVYSVSDAVATYYLYKTHIHDFIFALCSIVPLYPDDVLRKGSGTLCEQLLMAQAYSRNIIFPNKMTEKRESFYQGHLIESETYIGGHVECLEVGVYRCDFPVQFKLDSEAYQELIGQVEASVDFCAEIENGVSPQDIVNKQEVCNSIKEHLQELRDSGPLEIKPLIYHLDVAAMYPNIILSNRLQPTAIVSEKNCASCIYNNPSNNCKRNLSWEWRGELFPLKKGEYEGIKSQLEQDVFDGVPFSHHSADSQQSKIKTRVKEYCKRAYNQVHFTKTELKTDTVCMRENSFYVDTVRAFRDRRYDFKHKVKLELNNLKSVQSDSVEAKEAEERMNLFESLQLAHKIILNSFYGYVMRKGARWYSMEMAGMVTHMGGTIIRQARKLIERIGKPLELDTDGIWCLLPGGFPENFYLETHSGKRISMAYPCTMLNVLIYDSFKNPQYQTLSEDGSYKTHTEMSVFFEIDGPYRCMMIPASTEENKMLKKRYAVFNMAGKMTELKGFELKRRGELKLIKVFQEEIFDKYLQGTNLEECYSAIAQVADKWWDMLELKGSNAANEELIEYLCEDRVLSKSLSEYGAQKSTAITTAKRMGDLLGKETVEEKGLNCKFLISRKPEGAPVTERAVPAVVFNMEPEVRLKYLKLWLKDSGLKHASLESVIDWDYYKERLAGAIRKVITIPAIIQKLPNPTPRIPLPDWLSRKIKEMQSNSKQQNITAHFKPAPRPQHPVVEVKPKALEIPPLLDMSQAPDLYSEGWLAAQQQAWRQRRKHNLALKKFRKERVSKNISGYLKGKDKGLLYTDWQVIGCYQFEGSLFKMWIYSELGEMQCLNLEVKRQVYISSSIPRANSSFKSVKMKLPHNKSCNHLYEYSITETEFQEKSFLLSNALADSEIEGVYETKIPIQDLANIKMSCVLKPKTEELERFLEQKGNLVGHTFQFEDFEVKKDPYYLNDFQLFNKFYLLHVKTGVRSVWMFFNSNSFSIDTFVLVPGHSEKPSLAKFVKEAVKSQDWSVETHYPKNETLALKAIEKTIQEKKLSNSVILVCSVYSLEELRTKGLKSLIQDLAVIQLNKPNFVLPALNWQKEAIDYLCSVYEESFAKTQEKLGFARYANLPIGNVPEDPSSYLCDILFARSLKASRNILWWSKESVGDFGGEEDPESHLEDKDFYGTELCNPGLYSDIVIELDLGVLPINAILCYKHLHSGEVIEDNPNDERVVCLDSFRRIRNIVNTWVEDVQKYNNRYADALVMNCYRWLASRSSGMYDPLLHLTMHKLVEQLFKTLLTEIKKLGAKVVYAHSDKLIVNTGKANLEEAKQYCQFLIRNLTSTPTFAYLSLEPTKYWRVLLWKDSVNYAGIEISEQNFRISSQWHLLELLPEELGQLCLVILAQLLQKTHEYLDTAMEPKRIVLLQNIKQMLSNEIAPKLFESIHSILQSLESFEFPYLVGKSLQTTNPALEFVKIVTHILSLEPDLYQEVESLRKNLLRLLNYSDFSSEAEYKEPFNSLMLAEVICSNCLYTRDIDLCRDPRLSKGEWNCYLCNSSFEKTTFEMKLVRLLQRKIKVFQNQDLKCAKCRLNKGSLLARRCACSGEYTYTISRESFTKFLGTLSEVAEFHEMKYLQTLIPNN